MKHKLLFAISFITIFIVPGSLFSQKYWVMFKDKNGTPYSVSTPSAYLGPQAVARRASQGISIDNTDLPVTPSYVSQVDAVSGVTILYRSKWLNGVVISVTNTVALTTINTFTFVQNTNRVNRYKLTFPVISNPFNANSNGARTQAATGFNYGGATTQVQMLGADCMHNMGFRGQGMTIAVLDAGFTDVQQYDIFDSLFLQHRLLGTRDFVDGFGDTTVFTEHTHGAEVLSTMAGIKSGTIIGTAPKANYWLLRTEDGSSETISEEYNWIRGIEFADSVGANVTTTSLGYTTFDVGPPSANDHNYSQLNGKTAPMSIAATMAARKGIIVLNAAGNEGCGSPSSCWYYIAVPADADSIITVGAVDGSRVKAGFSSFGPTSDARIKPDLVAQGAGSWVCLYGTGCFPGNGTSFATPILAGAVTCLLQAKKFATPMQIISALKATADSAAAPNNRIGWGVPNMCSAMSSTILSVPSLEKNDHVKVYPNPFNNELIISLSDISFSNLSVTITNVLGQELYSQKVEDPSVTNLNITDVKNYKAGIYFVNINSSGFNITKKVVKQ